MISIRAVNTQTVAPIEIQRTNSADYLLHWDPSNLSSATCIQFRAYGLRQERIYDTKAKPPVRQ